MSIHDLKVRVTGRSNAPPLVRCHAEEIGSSRYTAALYVESACDSHAHAMIALQAAHRSLKHLHDTNQHIAIDSEAYALVKAALAAAGVQP